MADLTVPPPYYYIAYIDEAGDPGITRVRPIDNPGATEWFVLGCILIQATREHSPDIWVREILDSIGMQQAKLFHFRELLGWRKRLACVEAAKLPVRMFALISNKKNMRRHKNVRAAARSQGIPIDQVFYNFCTRLLLERVSDYCYRRSMKDHGQPRHVKVLLSERGTHLYGRAFSYQQMLIDQGKRETTYLTKRTIKWEVLDSRLMNSVPANSNCGLQLADIIASSFYQAVDILPPTHWNPQNAQALMPRVATENGRYRDYGVAFQPSRAWLAKLVPKQRMILEYYGYLPAIFEARLS